MSDEDEREERLRALRELAREEGATPTEPPTGTGTAHTSSLMATRRTRKPRWRLLAALLALVVVIVGVGAGVALHGRTSVPLRSGVSKLVSIGLGPTNLTCLSTNGSIAWSPDGSRLVFVDEEGTLTIWGPGDPPAAQGIFTRPVRHG